MSTRKKEESAERKRVRTAVEGIRKLWERDVLESKYRNDHWLHFERRQGYRDCLDAFKQAGIIEEYSYDRIAFKEEA